MTRFAWIQTRTEAMIAAVALAALTVAAVVTGPHLAHLYQSTVAACRADNTCDLALSNFQQNDRVQYIVFTGLVMAVPGLMGVFLGAPLVARELETGTFRLAWTQSVTRQRWLAVKLAVAGAVAVVATGLLTLAVTWWARAIDLAYADQFRNFDERGVAPLAYAAFAFVLGVVVGLLIRRVLPAVAATLAGFVAARFVVTEWIRPHLLPAAHTSLSLTSSSSNVGFLASPAGVTLSTSPPRIPNAWVLSSRVVDGSGRVASPQALHTFLIAHCPGIPQGPPASAGSIPGPGTFQSCLAQFSTTFHQAVTYQPASHYWPLQWAEMGVFLAAAAGLGALALWWIRRRP